MKTALKTLLAVGAVASVASAGTCFDYSIGNSGVGTLTGDGSWYQDKASAVVEAQAPSGTWYPISQGLDIASCPNGDSDGDGNSDCYYGWNDADMINADGVPEVRVTLSGWVSSSASSWGYTNGGLLYILDGTGLEQTSQYKVVDIGSSMTINAKIAAGKTAKIYLLESSYNSANASSALHKADAVGTGSFKDYVLPKSSFKTWAGAANENSANWAEVRAIAVEYEIGATSEGAPFPGQLQEFLGWQSLSVDNGGSACGGTSIGSKVAGQSVGFAALRNGLQFSNVGSAALNVQIFNTLGKVVASHKVTSKNAFVSTEGLSNGVYVVRATDGAKLNMMRNVTIMR